MTLVGSSTPTYDTNGNVTNDFLNSYAWDANGRPVTVDTVGVTYDALGRMVEQNRSGSYSQIAYTPGGGKLAIMAGSTIQKGFVPLTGGSMAIYNSSGLSYYRHSDWIGSSRLASTPTRTLYYDGAYGPFGEPYAQTGTNDLSFTGQNQDTASNVYDFPAREYGIQGRWPSPDPAGIGSASPASPQSWNRYAYVENSPLSSTDPTGLYRNPTPPPSNFIACNSDSCWPVANPEMDGGGGGAIEVDDGNSGDGTDSDSWSSPGGIVDCWGWIWGATDPCGDPTSLLSQTLNTLLNMVCSTMPQGQVVSVGGSIGAIGSTGGSANLVTNYNTGLSTSSLSGSLSLCCWNGAASGGVSFGLIFSNSPFSNSNYSGQFTTTSVTVGKLGGYVARGNGVTVVGASGGGSLINFPTFGVSVSRTPQSSGSGYNTVLSLLALTFVPGALSSTAATMACNALLGSN